MLLNISYFLKYKITIDNYLKFKLVINHCRRRIPPGYSNKYIYDDFCINLFKSFDKLL